MLKIRNMGITMNVGRGVHGILSMIHEEDPHAESQAGKSSIQISHKFDDSDNEK
jgi:hypothetical protein